jgi:hypothetical protein
MFPVGRRAVSGSTVATTDKAARSGSPAKPASSDGRVKDDVYVPARSATPFESAPQGPSSPAGVYRVFLPIIRSASPAPGSRPLRDGRVKDDVSVPARPTSASASTLSRSGGGGAGGGTGGFGGPASSFTETVAGWWNESLLGRAYNKWRAFTDAHTPSWLRKTNEVLALPPVMDALSFGITPIGGWGFVGEAAQGAARLDEAAAASRNLGPGTANVVSNAQQNGALVYRGRNLAGARFYGSNRSIDAHDVVDAVKALQSQGAREITVLTGTHGGAGGEIFRADTKELQFLVEDLRHVKGANVRVLNMNLVTRSQLERLSGHVYAAWCTSEESESWLEILEPGAR